VITNGYGAMPDYSAQVAPVDRWAIVAYIRALQLSQNATHADVPSGSHVEPLSSIAERQGLPATFADEWTLPSTAVTGTPNNQTFNLPVQNSNGAPAKATPGQPQTTPVAPPASAAPAGPTAAKQ
jgi:hypothetical protein